MGDVEKGKDVRIEIFSFQITQLPFDFRYAIPVHYHPKSRPARPIVMIGTVFASIKPVPEEWCQITGRMEVRPMSKHKTPIECQVSIWISISGKHYG